MYICVFCLCGSSDSIKLVCGFFSITPIEYPFKDAEPFNFLQPNLPVRDNICSNMISVNALKLEEILIYIDKWCFYNLAFYHLSIYTSFG